MQSEEFDFDALVAPLTERALFGRLKKITFLGILSPKFTHFPDHPLSPTGVRRNIADDGSRADHSMGVAKLMLRFCDAFGFPEVTRKYAVSWALLHDIATWPLSHTGEAAFAMSTGVTHRELRQAMILGGEPLPRELDLSNDIKALGLDPRQLAGLFDARHEPEQYELRALHGVIHSAITPDTLEGIYRTGQSIGVFVPPPVTILDAIDATSPDIFDAIVRRKNSGPVLKFWRAKSVIYSNFINSDRAIIFESRWSHAIHLAYPQVSVFESLLLHEDDVIDTVQKRGLPTFEAVVRYKPPNKYFLHGSLKHKKRLRKDQPIRSLKGVLVNNKK